MEKTVTQFLQRTPIFFLSKLFRNLYCNIFAGLVLGLASGIGYFVLILGFLMMGLATLFSFITLPVEYDASNRALIWLKNRNIVSRDEYKSAEDALRWAARTYLVAALGSLATLLYWAIQVFGRR